MTTRNFRDFLSALVLSEELHPEIKAIVDAKSTHKSKQSLIAKAVKDITSRGESTGIEGNMPKGSSRAYMKHSEPHQIHVDGKPVGVETGTKVAIKASLDKHHNKHSFGGLGLGSMQNEAENGDHWVNKNYRVLTEHDDKPGHYETNKEGGIFPPLHAHDDTNHEWSHVGHTRDLASKDFERLTKNKDYPKGISHKDFVDATTRFHDQNNGRYWSNNEERENHLDHVTEHPLVQKFIDYHGNSGNPPHDYAQKKNMGIWTHPVDGSEHIVARDHGFSSDVQKAYTEARLKMYRNR